MPRRRDMFACPRNAAAPKPTARPTACAAHENARILKTVPNAIATSRNRLAYSCAMEEELAMHMSVATKSVTSVRDSFISTASMAPSPSETFVTPRRVRPHQALPPKRSHNRPQTSARAHCRTCPARCRTAMPSCRSRSARKTISWRRALGRCRP